MHNPGLHHVAVKEIHDVPSPPEAPVDASPFAAAKTVFRHQHGVQMCRKQEGDGSVKAHDLSQSCRAHQEEHGALQAIDSIHPAAFWCTSSVAGVVGLVQ